MFSFVPRCQGLCGIAEVDGQPGVDAQLRVLGHFCALVPRERSAQLLGQRHDRFGNGVANCFCTVTGKRGSVLDAGFGAVALHRRKAQQHGEPGGALDEGADCRAIQTDDEVALPVAGNGTIIGFGGSLADHDLGGDELLPSSTRASPRHSQGSAGPQAGDELAFECTPALDVERLVDRLVGDPHGLIIGEIDPQPVRDLLGTPRLRPSTILARAVRGVGRRMAPWRTRNELSRRVERSAAESRSCT